MLNKMRINANEKGFTLIELMIVIAIIGILAAIAVPNFIAFRDKGYCSAAESDARSLGAALADYFSVPTRTSFGEGTPVASSPTPATATTPSVLTFVTAAGTNPGNAVTLSNLNTATIAAVANTNNYVITITEATNRCPVDYMAANPRWTAGTAPAGNTYAYTI